MPTGFHPGTLDLLALRYEPIATMPGLAVARYRTVPDRTSRHWLSLASHAAHRCGAAGGLAERSEFLVMTALSKASYWCHVGRWRAPNISVPLDSTQLCEHSALPRLLVRAMSASHVRARHLTIEVVARPEVSLPSIAPTLTRLHDIGIRLSYEPDGAPPDFAEFPFDELRVHFASPSAPPVRTCADQRRHPSLLASGVTTGDHLMAALAANASHIDGTFAGLVRFDRSTIAATARFDTYACV